MRPLLHPTLVNGPAGDPALYVEVLFDRRALLIDLGDLAALPSRKVLRVTHAFVSHTHMDHFCGFDRLLRVCLGREKRLDLFGPPGLIAQVGHKLAAYSWNLVQNYPNDFTLRVAEFHAPARLRTAAFRCRGGFVREDGAEAAAPDGVLHAEEGFRVRAAVLDHLIPCLGFAVEEPNHVNVWKTELEALGLGVGPWLRAVKQAVLRGDADDTLVQARWRADGQLREATLPLGRLKGGAVRVVPGQKLAYVTDAAGHADNAARIVELARDADILFIEAPFTAADADIAERKAHLTAEQAGTLARRAGAKRLVPFHFSPRYEADAARLAAEARAAFEATPTAETEA